MNDNSAFERDVTEAFDRESRGRPVPDAIHDELLTYAGRTRQRPNWLASIKEPPMRYSDSLAVGSPTLRVITIMVATLLLIIAVAAAGQRLFAADADYIVDADGSGTHTTIAAAVASAEDGESILIRDGTYAESVTITEDITLFGESREGVIIEFAAGCTLEGEGESFEQVQTCPPEVPQLDGVGLFEGRSGPFALHLDDANVQVSDMTFRHLSNGYTIYVNGGTLTVERVTFADNDFGSPNGSAHVIVRGGTSATFIESDFGAGAFEIVDRSPVTVERSTVGSLLSEAPLDEATGGPSIFRDNEMVGMIWAEGLHVIEGNEIELVDNEFETAGIFIAGPGSGWIVRDNIVRNSKNRTGAIDVGDQAGAGVIVDNVVEGSLVGILSSSFSLIKVEGNHVTGGETGIQALTGPVELIGNIVEDATVRGIMIGNTATLTGNVACSNETDLWIGRSADLAIDDTNEFCAIEDLRGE